jgi:Na+/phosphate symporter
MPNAKISETQYLINNNNEKFILVSNEVTKLGYREIYAYKDEDADALGSIFIDERLLTTPTIALDNCRIVTTDMAHWAQQSFDDSTKALFNYSEKLDKRIRQAEKMTDKYEDKLGSYLVKLSSSSISERDSAQASMLLKVIGDFERISDHARNIMLSGAELSEKKLSFTDEGAGSPYRAYSPSTGYREGYYNYHGTNYHQRV